MPFCALWLLIEQGCFFYFAMKLTPLLLDTPIFLMFSSVSFYLHLISFNFFDAHCNVFTFFAIMSLTHSLPQFHVGFCEQDCAAVAILVILVTPNTSLSSSRTMKRNEIQNIGTLKKNISLKRSWARVLLHIMVPQWHQTQTLKKWLTLVTPKSQKLSNLNSAKLNDQIPFMRGLCF